MNPVVEMFGFKTTPKFIEFANELNLDLAGVLRNVRHFRRFSKQPRPMAALSASIRLPGFSVRHWMNAADNAMHANMTALSK